MVKAQDVVRMYENMIQNLAEVPQLPGLEEDEELAATTAARVTALRYWRGSWTRQTGLDRGETGLDSQEVVLDFQETGLGRLETELGILADWTGQLGEWTRQSGDWN